MSKYGSSYSKTGSPEGVTFVIQPGKNLRSYFAGAIVAVVCFFAAQFGLLTLSLGFPEPAYVILGLGALFGILGVRAYVLDRRSARHRTPHQFLVSPTSVTVRQEVIDKKDIQLLRFGNSIKIPDLVDSTSVPNAASAQMLAHRAKTCWRVDALVSGGRTVALAGGLEGDTAKALRAELRKLLAESA